MGLWSSEGNYLGYFLMDLFHRRHCTSIFISCEVMGFTAEAYLFLGSPDIWPILLFMRSLPPGKKTTFHLFFYHINMLVN